jgi:hypothetical protein
MDIFGYIAINGDGKCNHFTHKPFRNAPIDHARIDYRRWISAISPTTISTPDFAKGMTWESEPMPVYLSNIPFHSCKCEENKNE